jgi:hypothetical protein
MLNQKNTNGGKMKINKIFEIGLPKTGTTSLQTAYKILGYRNRTWHPKLYKRWKEEGIEPLFKMINEFDAFEDGPWHDCDYKILDQHYPNSKFIILERNNDDWIRSKEKHESPLYNANKINSEFLFNEWITDRENYIKKSIQYKENKYKDIKEYFKDRPNDLLVMNICEGEGWEKLCPFLGKPIPNMSFPLRNVAGQIKE